MNSQTIKFTRNGQTIEGRVLARDSDPTAAVWVVDVKDADRDYMVRPSEIVA
jgi:hypothetical protein